MNKEVLWKNKWIFILAAVWSAAWLANLWKFPYLVYDNWGASFIIVYLILLFLIWLSLLIWELALGQMTRKAAVESFWSISKYFRWLWWFTVFWAFTILTYYVVVIGWGMDYLYYSLSSLTTNTLPWAWNAWDFFFWNVLWITDSGWKVGSISIPVLIWTFTSLILMYFFTFKSAKSVWKVVLFTATIPFITLIILALKAITLEWAWLGLAYLTKIDVSKLTDISVWVAAGWQIFFTLSVAMWVMIAYWAMKKEDSEIVKSTILVALWNTFVSFLSAIAVFWTLWYLAQFKWVPVSEVVKWWPSLVFVTIPEILTHFWVLSATFSVLFFLTIFLLAVDSAMSLIEAVVKPIADKFESQKTETLTLFFVILIWLFSITYIFGNWLYVLDVVDHYITQFGMLLIWIFELILFVYFSKKLWSFIDKHNKCFWKKLINKYFFLTSWVLAIWLLIFLFVKNIWAWLLVYDSYDKTFLIYYWLGPIIVMLIVSVLLNMLELNTKK